MPLIADVQEFAFHFLRHSFANVETIQPKTATIPSAVEKLNGGARSFFGRRPGCSGM